MGITAGLVDRQPSLRDAIKCHLAQKSLGTFPIREEKQRERDLAEDTRCSCSIRLPMSIGVTGHSRQGRVFGREGAEGRQQGLQSQRALMDVPKWHTLGVQLPCTHMGQHTHHVEVLVVVATQQKEEVGTGLVQRWMPAQLGEKPPQLPYLQ